ncbi:hypothetical protein [Pseudobacter ginsenosidimutans]|uniref:Uncharacterized protein n=1 Tax=Pseudobacter ginsenosidimutans TaxID=661488 RepID=A0A4Q7N5B7_9BACT|nr:hypothetical protein [Pseudobacter ginsenosidimutans]QEC44751.1 hypothetical protein FSB84_24840 [Pseudobacter ginsenosidimutans]RZS76236.1 hypothetical protein EV199_2115 [Pseudobacter ginsenosidimutans]
MHASKWEQELLCYRLRSVRSRKRTAKKAREKQLISLFKEENAFASAIWNLPWVPLQHPYQKGWKRSFVLRPDIKKSHQQAFFETLLKKINTTEYSPDKSFTKKKRSKGRKYRQAIEQQLREFWEHEWNDTSCKLTEAEKQLFYKKEYWHQSGKPYYKYVFSEPWRYVLRIRPHMITHKKMIDEELLSRRKQIENHITTHHLRHKIERLVWGKVKYRRYWDGKVARFRNPYKQKPVHLILQETGNEKEESWTR